jgi:hypothetical protein
MLKYRTVNIIDVSDWDNLVEQTYNRPYNFQQQDGCKDRGLIRLTIPDDETYDYKNDTVPEEVNHNDMGVSFKAWLARDPKQKLSNPADQENYCIDLWWRRNFYPDLQMVANDLHAKGLIVAGNYTIEIDW